MPYKYLWTADPVETFNNFLNDNEPKEDEHAIGDDEDAEEGEASGKE